MAAGKSTRTFPLTKNKPKPLLEVMGRPIISYLLQGLQDEVEEWIIVLGYREDEVREYIMTAFPDLNVIFVQQPEEKGTGAAIAGLQKHIGEDQFIVLNGDDLYHPLDIRSLIRSPERYGIMAKKVETPERFGILKTQGDFLVELVEKPVEYVGNLANIGVYKFDGSIFHHKLSISPRGEYEIVDYVNYLLKIGEEVEVLPVGEYWLPVTYPWDVLHAQEHFLKEADVKQVIHPSAKIDTTAYIGNNVYIGPNVIIGPEVEVANSCLYADVEVGAYCRIEGSVLSEGTKIEEGTIIDGSEEQNVMLPIAGGEPIKVDPHFKGVFSDKHTSVSGYITSPLFLE